MKIMIPGLTLSIMECAKKTHHPQEGEETRRATAACYCTLHSPLLSAWGPARRHPPANWHVTSPAPQSACSEMEHAQCSRMGIHTNTDIIRAVCCHQDSESRGCGDPAAPSSLWSCTPPGTGQNRDHSPGSRTENGQSPQQPCWKLAYPSGYASGET